MQRESGLGLPDIQHTPSHIGFPSPFDSFWANRVPHLTGVNPMLFLPHGGSSLSNMAAQYMQGKLNIGGLFNNYLTVSANGALNGLPSLYMRHPGLSDLAAAAAIGTQLNSRYIGSEPEQGLDFRRSSIDKLRLKAKEHSTDFDKSNPGSPDSRN